MANSLFLLIIILVTLLAIIRTKKTEKSFIETSRIMQKTLNEYIKKGAKHVR